MIDRSILLQHDAPVTNVVRFLDSSHLKPELQTVPLMFEELAAKLLQFIPTSPELTKTVQKLVEAKDQAVRAHIYAVEHHLRFPFTPPEESS